MATKQPRAASAPASAGRQLSSSEKSAISKVMHAQWLASLKLAQPSARRPSKEVSHA